LNELETNVLVMGRSGAGKSSFINYIYGDYKRETGTGRPVTKRGLHKVVQKHNDITVNLYDTWGLEANKSDEWKNMILNEVKSHNDSFSIKDWFHTIFYCLSAQSARVEDFEINEIINPLVNQGNRIVIVLTHGDVIDVEKKSKGMIDHLLNKTNLCMENIILVSNEAKKLLGGGVREQFGKEKVLKSMKTNLWFDIKDKLPQMYKKYLDEQFNSWKVESYEIVEKKVKFINRNSVCKKIIPEINYNLRTRLEIIDVETNKFITDSYEYYIKLVRYFSKTQMRANINFDKELNKSKLYFEISFSDRFTENLAAGIFSIIPVAGLFVFSIFKDMAKDNYMEEIDKSHKVLVNSVTDYVCEFEKVIDNYSREFMLLENSVK